MNQAQPNQHLKSLGYRAFLLLVEILKRFASNHHFQLLDELSSKAAVSINSTEVFDEILYFLSVCALTVILYQTSEEFNITLKFYGFVVKLGNVSLLLRHYFMSHVHLVVKMVAKWGSGLPPNQPKLKFS